MIKRNFLGFFGVTALMVACGGSSSLGSGSGTDGGGNGAKGGSGSQDAGNAGGSGGSTGGSAGSTGGSGGSGYQPCAGRACGAECSVCDPKDPNCAETAVLKYCSAGGQCGSAYPVCGSTNCTSDNDCPVIGAPCQQCPDGSYACPSNLCQKGQCVASFPTCGAQICKTDLDCPRSLAPCQICPDGTSACPYSKCVSGQCVGGFPGCSGYEPCAGKACGETCTQCSPLLPGCVETAVIKFCDAKAVCSSTAPVCDANQCKVKEDCPAVGACPPCTNGGCAELDCIAGKCQFACAPPNPPQCKSAQDCPAIQLCKQCPNLSCAQIDCLNGRCDFVCR